MFAKVLLVFGLVMIALSLMLRAANQPGSPEEIVSTLNICLGVLMVLLASGYLAYWKKKNKSNQSQPHLLKAKGDKIRKTPNPPTKSVDP